MTEYEWKLPFGLDPLIAEARQRARRRRSALLAAAVVLVVAGGGGTGGLFAYLHAQGAQAAAPGPAVRGPSLGDRRAFIIRHPTEVGRPITAGSNVAVLVASNGGPREV